MPKRESSVDPDEGDSRPEKILKADDEKSSPTGLRRDTHSYDPKRANAGVAANPGKVKSFRVDGDKVSNYVYRVVLTGGPCAGKSSSLDDLTKALSSNGYDVLCVPEVPTILLNGGCKYPGVDASNKEALLIFEKALIEAQIQLERSFIDIAESVNRPTVVIMDRGLLDVAAYLPDDLWKETLQKVGLTEQAMAERYDVALHLVTAADGAEEFYTCENNEARMETPEQAKELDGKIKKCYERMHKNVKVVDNSTDFKGKLKRATDFVLEYLNAGPFSC